MHTPFILRLAYVVAACFYYKCIGMIFPKRRILNMLQLNQEGIETIVARAINASGKVIAINGGDITPESVLETVPDVASVHVLRTFGGPYHETTQVWSFAKTRPGRFMVTIDDLFSGLSRQITVRVKRAARQHDDRMAEMPLAA
jgi:hypothetical protein